MNIAQIDVPKKLRGRGTLFLSQFLKTKKIASNKCFETFLSFLHVADLTNP